MLTDPFFFLLSFDQTHACQYMPKCNKWVQFHALLAWSGIRCSFTHLFDPQLPVLKTHPRYHPTTQKICQHHTYLYIRTLCCDVTPPSAYPQVKPPSVAAPLPSHAESNREVSGIQIWKELCQSSWQACTVLMAQEG